MHMDFITGALPESVIVGGKSYAVRWDYRIGMQFDRIRSDACSDENKFIRILQLYYPVIPNDLEKAMDAILWFYRGGEDPAEETEENQRYQRRNSKEPAYSFLQDAPYIYAAFREQYGIDLLECKMHWWKFMALFESLSEDTKMSKIMYYRKANTSGMPKERRAFVNEMKKLYQIKSKSGKTVTLNERDRRWKDYVSERMKAAANK